MKPINKKFDGMLGRKMKATRNLKHFAIGIFSIIALFVSFALSKEAATSLFITLFIVAAFISASTTKIKSNNAFQLNGVFSFYRDPNPGEGGGTEEGLLEKIKVQTKSAIELAVKNQDEATKKELKALSDLIEKLKMPATPEEFKSLKEEHIELMKELKALKENPIKEVQVKNLRDALMDAFLEKKDVIDAIIKNGGKQDGSLCVEVKAAVDMSDANTILSGATATSLTQFTGIISKIRQRAQMYLANVSVGSISTERAMWIEETDQQGVPIMLAEGATATQLSVLYVEKFAEVRDISVYGKVTLNMMSDLPQLISYIQTNIMKRLDIKIEDELFNGSGTGVELQGAIGKATAFSAGAAAGTIQAANEFDVINAIATQVELAFGISNAIFIHPVTMQKMKALKNSQGTPLWKDYTDMFGDIVISGMKVTSTPAITADTFLAGDLSVMHVLFREELGIVIGLDGNDFINKKKTMLASKRLVQFVSANDVPVLITGDFTSAKAALATV